jgi:hypothetical protein
MPSVVQRKPNRGRPRHPFPPRPPLALSILQHARLTGDSQQTVRRRIKEGKLRSIQASPGAPHRIPTSELVRLGYIASLSELMI